LNIERASELQNYIDQRKARLNNSSPGWCKRRRYDRI